MTAANDRYFVDNSSICRNGKEGVDILTNFEAVISKQITYHDGPKKATVLELAGKLSNGTALPAITIPAGDFAGLGWVAEKWGMEPIIFNVPGAERDIRTAIQMLSTPEKQDVYTHTGWTVINKEPTYLTAGGGITQAGLDPTITVSLPHELSRYTLPPPTASKEAFTSSLRLVNAGPKDVLWPMLLATYRAAVGPSDFALHLAGRTGTFKSEMSSLFQSHYGVSMDARNLPASWNSTANALEALAYRAMHAIMVIDDFVPVGVAYQVRGLQAKADQIIRAQGNQAGRSRLTDASQMQTTYYPRGLILSTGEDVPEGHSVRARMLILELSPGDVPAEKLTAAQAVRPHYSQAMADWIHWLSQTNAAERLKSASRQIRDRNLGVGHSRTPPIIGDLIATAELIAEYAVHRGFYDGKDMVGIVEKAAEAVKVAASKQAAFLESSDPVTAFIDTLRTLLTSQEAHLKTPNGGVPQDAEQYGWTTVKTPGAMDEYKSNGPRIGWVSLEDGEVYVDPDNLTLLKRHSGGRLSITPQTLLKRLKEAGVLTRTDETRSRNTIRLTLEGAYRSVLAINLDEIAPEKN